MAREGRNQFPGAAKATYLIVPSRRLHSCGPWKEGNMRCSLDTGFGLSPAWKRLLLTGTLLASCTCSASLEPPSSVSPDSLTEGAVAVLPVPSNIDGVLATSWFRGHEARPETMIFSPEGLPGPGHTGRETLGTQGSLVIRNVTAQDSGSYTVVLETSRGRRSKTEQIRIKASSDQPLLVTFPTNIWGVVQSELNYSVVMQCLTSIRKPMIYWTFNGKPYEIGEYLIIRKLSWKDLGTYACVVKNNQEQHSSKSVTISLPQNKVDPTEAEPVEPDPVLRVSGGGALALIVAGNIGFVMLIAGISFTIVQGLRQSIRTCR
ncbi:immunoglobulin superfamily member 23 [Rhinolophus ferrumequinum]|uniref:Ig-like domain-containing protein n=1 Tax=Rhinolophus ferrumequinum TaxID=59479 RepID=A0A671E3J4_RHIFE|nr:immunoglobulin superfamily member 23 [Rhinolophus ferrumequinum]